MRKLPLYLLLGVFYTATQFAVADSNVSRAIPTKSADDGANIERTNDTDSTSNRAARRIGANTSVNTDSKTNANRVASRNINTQSKPTEVVSRGGQKNTGVISRSVTRTRNVATRTSAEEAATTFGRNARVSAASINNTAAAKRAGVVLRASTAEVGGRAIISGTDKQTGSNVDEELRASKNRASITGGGSSSKQKRPTAESIAEAKDLLEKTADLNSTCQKQYNECMDQFCAVVDANQKRCSCSGNLSRYEKAQKAVEEANTELNNVAQRIRYIGLSADEIRAIMTATEAEQEMTKTRDTTKTRSMLDDIADMIKDPTAKTNTYTANSDNTLNMDFDFDADSADTFSLDMFGSSGTNDISSKRGKDLYKEAVKRCKPVLQSCKDAGGTESQISGNYDLAIDKDCVAYEQGLKKLNDTLVSNVRSANLMLQKARLSVMQNKNEYDIKECIAALDTCMLDDMVCGTDYVKCLDPTKRYIDENGNVVLGQNIANITAFLNDPDDVGQSGYDNSAINADFIKNSEYDKDCKNHDGACIVRYLMTKIGTGQTVKEGGLCRAVLDKCQAYTYKEVGKKSEYDPYNEVVINYIQRAMVNIKAAQSRIISNYASTCMSNIATCYNQQITQVNSYTAAASVDSVYSIMTGACYNVALTCGYAVYAYDIPMGLKMESINNVQNNDINNSNVTNVDAFKSKEQKLALIQGISELFYQSLLCPDNSSFSLRVHAVDPNRTVGRDAQVASNEMDVFGNPGYLAGQMITDPATGTGYVNARCKCNDGYTVWNGACLPACAQDEYRDSVGTCEVCTGQLKWADCKLDPQTGECTEPIEADACEMPTTSSTTNP